LRAEDFSCSFGVLYGCLGISKLQFLIRKIFKKISAVKFFPIFGHQNLGSGSRSAIRKNAGSGSALNQCGSETLHFMFLLLLLDNDVPDSGGVVRAYLGRCRALYIIRNGPDGRRSSEVSYLGRNLAMYFVEYFYLLDLANIYHFLP
jgi:hypothetical protein